MMTAMLTARNILAGRTNLRRLERERGRRVSGVRCVGSLGERALGAAPVRRSFVGQVSCVTHHGEPMGPQSR